MVIDHLSLARPSQAGWHCCSFSYLQLRKLRQEQERVTCERSLRPLVAPLGTDPGLLELDVTSSSSTVPRGPGFQATAGRCSVSPTGLSISPCPAKPDRFPPPEHVKRAPSFLGVFLLLYWQQSLGNAQQRWECLSLNHQPHVLQDPLLFARGVAASPAGLS